GSRNAKGLARRLAEPSDDFIDRLYMTVLVRSPQDSERAAAQDFISQFASEEAGWTSFCKMLLASNEFHYVD
ncbi:MAG: hypothetical protein O3A53_18185, partial [Acidobacteria bacterium]|nr:hypothetical protein [Acidobacteriota bacterium]